MPHNSRNCLDSNLEFGMRNGEFGMKNIPNSEFRTPNFAVSAWFVACCVSLVTGLTGCESFQRKFTRKPTTPGVKPSPVLYFEDYSQSMTPVDRYRKHYIIFEYWNGELIGAFGENNLNPKRLKRSSKDALDELRTMRRLLADDFGTGLDLLIDERASVDRQIQQDGVPASRASAVVRVLESQISRIHHEFYWRGIEEHLKPRAQGPAAAVSTGSDARTP